jgi:hypothetical protein
MTFKEAQERLALLAQKYGRDYTAITYSVTRMEYTRIEPFIRAECSLYADGLGGSHAASTREDAFVELERHIAEKGVQPVTGTLVEIQAPE